MGQAYVGFVIRVGMFVFVVSFRSFSTLRTRLGGRRHRPSRVSREEERERRKKERKKKEDADEEKRSAKERRVYRVHELG